MPGVSELLGRTHRVLLGLQLLAEGPAAKALDADFIKGGTGGSRDPASSEDLDSLLDRHLSKLKDWLIDAENALDHHKFRPPAREPESAIEWAERVIKPEPDGHEGVHYKVAASRENCNFMAIRRARSSQGREPLFGHEKIS